MDHPQWTTRQNDIPSEAEAAKQVIDEVLAELHSYAWSEQDVFAVHLAIEEAVVNAIKHGNDNNAEKRVRIDYRVSASELHIEIEDEGPGFRPEDVPDPTADENLEKPCGRGLMLMRSFMNTVDFNRLGNRVRLEKTCER
ncbi:ATP-binding protein [Lignipirellula cremea]|nr:ATP-binding protein [Lignipirellula cremea]